MPVTSPVLNPGVALTSLEHRRIWEKCAHQGGTSDVDRPSGRAAVAYNNKSTRPISFRVRFLLSRLCLRVSAVPPIFGGWCVSLFRVRTHVGQVGSTASGSIPEPAVRAVGALLLTHRTRNTQQNVRGTATALSFLVYRPCYDLANHWCRQRCVCIFDALSFVLISFHSVSHSRSHAS